MIRAGRRAGVVTVSGVSGMLAAGVLAAGAIVAGVPAVLRDAAAEPARPAPRQSTPATPAPGPADAPPAKLLSGQPARGAALDPIFRLLAVDRLRCSFSEEKKVALLARPLRSSGTIVFDRTRGIARATTKPRVEQVVLTRTTLRIKTARKTEEIPLDKSKDLRAFALIFPTLLAGDRAGLERSFELGLYGSDKDWWALSFVPKTASLKKLVRRVVVFGRAGAVVSLQVDEANGDSTETRLTDVAKNALVSDTEIATAFGGS